MPNANLIRNCSSQGPEHPTIHSFGLLAADSRSGPPFTIGLLRICFMKLTHFGDSHRTVVLVRREEIAANDSGPPAANATRTDGQSPPSALGSILGFPTKSSQTRRGRYLYWCEAAAAGELSL